MPRTSRRTATTGLAWEALAPLVRWPLHSPQRLAAVLAAMVAIVWLLATLRPPALAGPGPTESMSSTNPPVAAAPAPSSTANTGATSTALNSTRAAQAPSSPAEVALRFVTAWARPDLPVQVWQVDVIALATTEFGAQLRTVAPGNVPARQVLAAAVVGSVTELAAVATVPTDVGPVVVDLAVMGDRWKVSGLTPAGPPPTRTDGAGSSLAATYKPLPDGG